MMGTTADKLLRLSMTKDSIKAALASKGVEVPEGTPFREYPALIDSLGGLSNAEIAEIEAELAELLQETDLGWVETLGGYSIAAKIRFLQLCRGNILNAILKKSVEIPDSQPFRTIGELINQIKTEFATQEKTVIPTTEDQTVTPDSGYDGLSAVTVKGYELNKVSEVSVDKNTDTFTVRLSDGTIHSGSAFFDFFGLPTSMTDDQGNTVTFDSLGYPVTVTNGNGDTVNIY